MVPFASQAKQLLAPPNLQILVGMVRVLLINPGMGPLGNLQILVHMTLIQAHVNIYVIVGMAGMDHLVHLHLHLHHQQYVVMEIAMVVKIAIPV